MKQVNESGINQRLAARGVMGVRVPNVRYGKREDRSTDYVSSQLFYISVSSSSSNESGIELSIVRVGPGMR